MTEGCLPCVRAVGLPQAKPEGLSISEDYNPQSASLTAPFFIQGASKRFRILLRHRSWVSAFCGGGCCGGAYPCAPPCPRRGGAHRRLFPAAARAAVFSGGLFSLRSGFFPRARALGSFGAFGRSALSVRSFRHSRRRASGGGAAAFSRRRASALAAAGGRGAHVLHDHRRHDPAVRLRLGVLFLTFLGLCERGRAGLTLRRAAAGDLGDPSAS